MPQRSSKLRSLLVAAVIFLSSLGVMVSAVSLWAHRTVFNTDQWVATVGPLAKDPRVVSAVSARVAQEVNQAVQPQKKAADLLPSSLKRLAAPIAEGFEEIISGTVTRLMHSDEFQKFWIAANRKLQPKAAAALLGQNTRHLTTANGTIQLNLLPLVSKLLSGIQARAPSLVPTHGPIPTITSDTPVTQARNELSDALGHPLPPNFGTFTLFTSTQLATAQDIVKTFNTLIIALVVVTGGLIVAAIAIAERRRRAVIALTIGIIAAMGLAFATTKVIANQIVDAITNPSSRGAIRATVDSVVSRLNNVSIVLIGFGLIVLVVALLAGPSRIARSVRHQGRSLGRSVLKRDHAASPTAVIWIAEHRMLFALAGLAIAVVVLIFVIQGWIGLLVCLLVLAAYEGSLAWIAGTSGAGVGEDRSDGAVV